MDKDKLSRRGFLAGAVKTVLATLLGTVIKLVPETTGVLASQRDFPDAEMHGDLKRSRLDSGRIEELLEQARDCADVSVLRSYLHSRGFGEISRSGFGLRIEAKIPSGKQLMFDIMLIRFSNVIKKQGDVVVYMTGVSADVTGIEGALAIVSKDNVYRNQDGLAVVYDGVPSTLAADNRVQKCQDGLESLKSLARLDFNFAPVEGTQTQHKRAKRLQGRACCADLFTCFALTGGCGLSIILFVLCPPCFQLALIICGGGIIECTNAMSCCIANSSECQC